MKKVLTLLLALIMIIGVVACAPQEKKEEAPAKEATKEEKKEEPTKTEAASEEKKEEAPAEESKEEKKDEETKAEAAPAEGGDVVKLGVFEPFTGAVIGGLILGMSEILIVGLLPSLNDYRDGFAFVILILILIIKPTGLFGSNVKEKV